MSPNQRRGKLLKSGNDVIIGLELKVGAPSLFFVDPAATHVLIEEHPTQNGLIIEIIAEEVIR